MKKNENNLWRFQKLAFSGGFIGNCFWKRGTKQDFMSVSFSSDLRIEIVSENDTKLIGAKPEPPFAFWTEFELSGIHLLTSVELLSHKLVDFVAKTSMGWTKRSFRISRTTASDTLWRDRLFLVTLKEDINPQRKCFQKDSFVMCTKWTHG